MNRLILRARGKKQKYLRKKNLNKSDSSLDVDDSENINLVIGRIINDKYVILKYLDNGSFCKVYLVYDFMKKRYFALKIQNPEDNDELENEYNLLNIIQKNNNIEGDYKLGIIYDRCEIKIDGIFYRCLLFELLGNSLCDIIDNVNLKMADVKTIIKSLLNALNLCKKHNIAHCDMKPDNILLSNINDNLEEYINDFEKLDLFNKYGELIEDNLPKDFYSLGKSKRKNVKKKIKSRVVKMVIKEELPNILELNDKYSNLDFEEWDKGYEVKLIDFGNADIINNYDNETLYIRSYRPPENIIHEKLTQESDLWFVGCYLYELLTGKILFELKENNDSKLKRDRKQLNNMRICLGDMSKNLVFENDEFNNELFDIHGKLKYRIGDKKSIDKLLKENVKIECSDDELNDIIDFIKSILKYNPEERETIENLLNYNLLKIK